MPTLDAQQITDFSKERQARQVRALRQAHNIVPTLAVVGEPALAPLADIQAYAADILVECTAHPATELNALNQDSAIIGVIGPQAGIAPDKDIAGATGNAIYDDVRATAVLWLLAGYNIDLAGKKVLIIGEVVESLTRVLASTGASVQFVAAAADELLIVVRQVEIIVVTAAQSGLHSSMLAPGTVVVNTGAADAIDLNIYQRHDIFITLPGDGLRPLVLCALFDNMIRAAGARRIA